MEESIKQIGERLKGLREVLNIPAQEVADLCGISLEHYQKIESTVSARFPNATALISTSCSLAKSHA